MANLPKIVMQRLQETSAAGVHPDPNLISAFAENSLSNGARAQILDHLAQCLDCREVVFLSSPDQAATLPAAVAVPSSWLTWPVLRWGAAVAAVVVVAAAVSLHRPSGTHSDLPAPIQMTDAPAAKETAASAPIPEEKRDAATTAKSTPVPPATKNESAGKPEEPRKEQSSRMAASPAMQAQNSAVGGGRIAEQRTDELDKATTVEVSGAASAAGSVAVERDEVVPGRAKDAAEPGSGASGGMGGNAPGATAAFRAAPSMLLPMGAPRWTLTSDGTLQRSLDFGRSWQTVQVVSQASFRALAASGRDIWVGGAKGALYHSTDAGHNWTQVQPVFSGQALSDDIIGVEFPDALRGRLTTATKEIWTTEDSGQTWRKQ
jgi:hypothetical protein